MTVNRNGFFFQWKLSVSAFSKCNMWLWMDLVEHCWPFDWLKVPLFAWENFDCFARYKFSRDICVCFFSFVFFSKNFSISFRFYSTDYRARFVATQTHLCKCQFHWIGIDIVYISHHSCTEREKEQEKEMEKNKRQR